jgi:hypothetical protein
MDLRTVQRRAWENKLAHGFNTTDVPADLKRLHGEVDEAIEARQLGGDGFGSEIADTLIYACGLGEMARLDIADEVGREAVTAASDGHGITNIDDGLQQMHNHVDKAQAAWEQGGAEFGSTLARFVRCTWSVGELAGLDVAAEVEGKLAVIAKRNTSGDRTGSW